MSSVVMEGWGLSIWFPDKFLFKDLDIIANEGDMIAVIGPSGIGKTTLLKILGLLMRPVEGRVIIRGLDTSEYPERKLYLLRQLNNWLYLTPKKLYPLLSYISSGNWRVSVRGN